MKILKKKIILHAGKNKCMSNSELDKENYSYYLEE